MRIRSEKILNNLIFSQYPIPIDKLARENNVSIRTIRNDISEINNFLNVNAFNLVENIRNKGVRLDISNKDFENITSLLEKNSEEIYLNKNIRKFNLILEIVLGSKFFVYEKEKEFDISKSTLDSDMRDIRSIFETYNLELISDSKKGIMLTGPEITIRTMVFNQIFENLGTMDVLDKTKHCLPEFQVLFQFMSFESIYKINKLYKHFFSKSKAYIYKEQSIIFMAIWINRNIRGNTLDNEAKESNTELNDELYTFIKRIVSEFGLVINKKEIKYIYFMLNTLLNKDQDNPVEWINAQVFTIRLINHIEDELSISFDDETDILYERLLEHNLGLFSRIKNNIQIYNPLTENIKKNYADTFNAVQIFLNKNLILNYNEINNDEVAFLAIHFLSILSKKEQEEIDVYKAVVLCNYGVATGALLAENLKQYFPIDVIAVLSTSELDLLSKLEADIVFSTSPIKIEDYPYLVVDPIMNNKNKNDVKYFLKENSQLKRTIIRNPKSSNNNTVIEIIELIESIYGKMDYNLVKEIIDTFNKNGLSINTKEMQPMIKDVLSDDGINLNLNVRNWEEAIIETSRPLLERGTIEDSYVDAMVNSVKEYGPYIVIGKHLALAHARPEDGVNQLGLSVATLNPPIPFGNEETDPVKIIFCLAATDSYSHLNIMKSLVNLLNDKADISELSDSNNKKDFKNKLFNY